MPFGRTGILLLIRENVGVWLPKKSGLECDGFEGKRSEDTSSEEYSEQSVENLAVEVVGQNWSSQVISLFLDDWEVGQVALSCHSSMDLVCQELWDACWEELRVSGLSSLLVFFECQERWRRRSDA